MPMGAAPALRHTKTKEKPLAPLPLPNCSQFVTFFNTVAKIRPPHYSKTTQKNSNQLFLNDILKIKKMA